jgi:hypothetical protein
MILVATKNGRAKNFFPSSFGAVVGSGIRDPGSWIRDPGSGIRGPGWIKIRIWDKHPGLRIHNTASEKMVLKHDVHEK